MSIETENQEMSAQVGQSTSGVADSVRHEIGPASIAKLLRAHRDSWKPGIWFKKAARKGSVYRWGIAVSSGSRCTDLIEVLSRFACGVTPSNKRLRALDLQASLRVWIDHINRAPILHPFDGAMGVLWSASLPSLADYLEDQELESLLVTLLELHQAIIQRNDTSSPLHLVLGGEMGLTLALGSAAFQSCSSIRNAATKAIEAWIRCDDEAISAAITSGADARLILASLIRCKHLVSRSGVKRFNDKSWMETGTSLATWIAVLTHRGGRSALSDATEADVGDDCRTDGLLQHAAKFNSTCLKPAISAARGAAPKGGRLAWQVNLPETMQHDHNSKLAVLLPDWDVQRGRVHVDYSETEPRLELFAGAHQLLAGAWQTSITTKGASQQPTGDWQEVCEYTDDDVHYLEIEQNWTGDLVLQRQVLLIREDRCVMLADAILPNRDAVKSGYPVTGSIRHTTKIPLGKTVVSVPEDETRELYLNAGKRRAMVLPLAANEWRIGATSSNLTGDADQGLVLVSEGYGSLYSPIWIDLRRRRFKRKRTWRQLTITDQLRLVGREEAVGYRVQVGSEQWMTYRSLGNRSIRSVLGKHLIAAFYCSRFDAGDGSHEELITVDDVEEHE